jgi:gluconate 2-dehydrogenase subunit 3-like protein
MEKEESGNLKRSFNRRELLKVMTAVPTASLIPLTGIAAEQSEKPAPAAAAAPAVKVAHRKVLTEHEYKTVSVLSDIIIPADDRSGSATQAKVPDFIDDWLDFKGGFELDAVRGGLTWLDIECNRLFNHDFVDCSDTQKKQILDRIAYPKTAALEDAGAVVFFNHMRDLVVSGFFSSEMGVKDLPYLGNQMLAEWTGCPAEVMTKIEENEKEAGGRQ